MYSTELDIITDGFALDTLLRSIYKNPEVACIRELICNAIDSHIDSGCTHLKPEVSFDNNIFYLRDYGNGLSQEEVHSILGVVFKSTKRRDDYEGTGSFGLGSKTVFSMLDVNENNEHPIAWLTSIHEGIKSMFVLMKNDSGMPTITPFYCEKTDEPSGLLYEIPMNSKMINIDLRTFLKVFAPFYGKISFVGSYDYFKHFKLFTFNNIFHRAAFTRLLINNVSDMEDIDNALNQSLAAFKNVSSLFITANDFLINDTQRISMVYDIVDGSIPDTSLLRYNNILKHSRVNSDSDGAFYVRIDDILYPFSKVGDVEYIFSAEMNREIVKFLNAFSMNEYEREDFISIAEYVDYVDVLESCGLETTRSRDSIIEHEPEEVFSEYIEKNIREGLDTSLYYMSTYSKSSRHRLPSPNLVESTMARAIMFSIVKYAIDNNKDLIKEKLERYLNECSDAYQMEKSGLDFSFLKSTILMIPEIINFLNGIEYFDIASEYRSFLGCDTMSVDEALIFLYIFKPTSLNKAGQLIIDYESVLVDVIPHSMRHLISRDNANYIPNFEINFKTIDKNKIQPYMTFDSLEFSESKYDRLSSLYYANKGITTASKMDKMYYFVDGIMTQTGVAESEYKKLFDSYIPPGRFNDVYSKISLIEKDNKRITKNKISQYIKNNNVIMAITWLFTHEGENILRDKVPSSYRVSSFIHAYNIALSAYNENKSSKCLDIQLSKKSTSKTNSNYKVLSIGDVTNNLESTPRGVELYGHHYDGTYNSLSKVLDSCEKIYLWYAVDEDVIDLGIGKAFMYSSMDFQYLIDIPSQLTTLYSDFSKPERTLYNFNNRSDYSLCNDNKTIHSNYKRNEVVTCLKENECLLIVDKNKCNNKLLSFINNNHKVTIDIVPLLNSTVKKDYIKYKSIPEDVVIDLYRLVLTHRTIQQWLYSDPETSYNNIFRVLQKGEYRNVIIMMQYINSFLDYGYFNIAKYNFDLDQYDQICEMFSCHELLLYVKDNISDLDNFIEKVYQDLDNVKDKYVQIENDKLKMYVLRGQFIKMTESDNVLKFNDDYNEYLKLL